MNGTGTPLARLNTYNFERLPLLGTTAAGQEIRLGGFSGLWFEGFSAGNGRLRFTNTGHYQ
jgi:3-phytase